MAEKITYRFLPEDKCLTERQLFDYIDKKLGAAEMHAVEKHLLSCEMCSDALEGYEKIQHREKVAAFSPDGTLKNGAEKSIPKVIPLNPNRKYYAIAAGIILIVAVSLYFKMNVSADLENSKTADLVQRDSSVSILQAPQSPAEKNEKKSDSLVAEDFKIADKEKPKREEGPVSNQPQQNYSGNFGFFDTLKVSDGEASGNAVNTQSLDQANEDIAVQPVPDALADRSVLSETVPPEYKKQEKDAEKNAEKNEEKAVEQKTIAQNTGADDEQEAKTKAPAKNDSYANNRDNDKSQGGKGNDANAKEATHENANVPASTQTAAPVSVGSTSSGTTTTVVTDAVSGNDQTSTSDSTVAKPKFYPLKPSDKDLDLSYENGVKMLESGQATASLVFFDEVLKNPAHHYFEDAQWKKATALIQLNRKAEAKVLLQEIVTKGGKYKSQATEELKKL